MLRVNDHHEYGIASNQPPILFLHDHTCDDAMVHAFDGFGLHRARAEDRRALTAWRELEAEYNSSCIGLIATSSGAACQILSQGIAGAPLPGAIALLGWTARDLAALPSGSDASGLSFSRNAVSPMFEWPELRVILRCDSPDLGLSARIVRSLRARNIPIALEVVSDLTEIVEELDRFFATHLTPVFPKMN
jgi:hypothetical protein